MIRDVAHCSDNPLHPALLVQNGHPSFLHPTNLAVGTDHAKLHLRHLSRELALKCLLRSWPVLRVDILQIGGRLRVKFVQ